MQYIAQNILFSDTFNWTLLGILFIGYIKQKNITSEMMSDDNGCQCYNIYLLSFHKTHEVERK